MYLTMVALAASFSGRIKIRWSAGQSATRGVWDVGGVVFICNSYLFVIPFELGEYIVFYHSTLITANPN